jgi:hypothetical protein
MLAEIVFLGTPESSAFRIVRPSWRLDKYCEDQFRKIFLGRELQSKSHRAW